jgi:IstB-like ATP binding protein
MSLGRFTLPTSLQECLARLEAVRAKNAQAASFGDHTATARACSECSGGWRTVPTAGIERAERCACTIVGVHADGVPSEFVDVTLGNYREEEGNSRAMRCARQFRGSSRDLYLYGGVGSGKTRLACSLLNEHARSRHTAYFARVPWMLHALQPGRDQAGALEERIATTSLLVLDDLGAERDQATDYTRRTLLMLYEQRHDRGLRTIFTSNKSVQELAEMQDDGRLASRLVGQAEVVRLTTPDQRRATRQATLKATG